MDFLNPKNIAGQTLLRIVSRGNSIIAELLRLSEHVPSVFRDPQLPQNKQFADLLSDFKYFNTSDYFESKIENSPILIEKDREFRNSNEELLSRFYLLMESIYKYIMDLKKYLVDLEEGNFISLTMDNLLLDVDGKQLMAEAIYLVGIVMILLDMKLPGIVRERILIAYYRYKGPSESPLIDEVCKLLRNTGYIPNSKKQPKGYPESFLDRAGLNKNDIMMVIARLRMDDIYSQISNWPIPEHRSSALSTQARMLYIILYFVPEVLHNETSIMREIVDKHFADNWIIAIYLGYLIDLSEEWVGYKAAKLAINNTIDLKNIAKLEDRHYNKIPTLLKELNGYLLEGVLNERYVLDNPYKLLNCIRHCNDTLRWFFLQSTTENKKLSQIINQRATKQHLLALLLKTAQFEFLLKRLFEKLLTFKQNKWDFCKKDAAERMSDLSRYFSGEVSLTRVVPNENLKNWFAELSRKVNDLDYENPTIAGRKIQQLIQALVEVEEYEEIDKSTTVKEFLKETREQLQQMIRVVNILEDHLVVIYNVADISYSWEVINTFIPLMQKHIRDNPKTVILLRSTFLKLSSILDLTVLRINQAESPDLFSVSEYYSGLLVSYVRRVLEIIPKSMFEILNTVIEIQTTKLRELPPNAEKDKLFKEWAQLPSRFQLASSTHQVSVFTEGILAMETTLVGIIKVDPKQLLEDGIRKELVKVITTELDNTLIFPNSKIELFEEILKKLAHKLDGFRRSFEYISDYVSVYGLKIWQEEFSRIINYHVEQECATFLKKKIYYWQSVYYSEAIPIPRFPPKDNESKNFIGRLSRVLLEHTNIQTTIYLDHMNSWYDLKTSMQLIGLRTFTLLHHSMGVFGLSGVDQVMSFKIVLLLQQLTAVIEQNFTKSKTCQETMSMLRKFLEPTPNIPTDSNKLYISAVTKLSKLWPILVAKVTEIGQMQLLRKQIANNLNFSVKLDSNIFSCSLDTFNKSLLNDIKRHYKNPNLPYPSEGNTILSELTKYLETTGMNDPFTKIYITKDLPTEDLGLLIFLLVLSQVLKFNWNHQLGVLVFSGSKKEQFDFTPFVIGIITFLKQFHSHQTQKFLAYMGQYIRASINYVPDPSSKKKNKILDYPHEVRNVLLFIEEFTKYSYIQRKVAENYFPSYILDHYFPKTEN